SRSAYRAPQATRLTVSIISSNLSEPCALVVAPGKQRRDEMILPSLQADRNLIRRSVVSAGFSSGKKCPPWTACPRTSLAHFRQIPSAPPYCSYNVSSGPPEAHRCSIGHVIRRFCV